MDKQFIEISLLKPHPRYEEFFDPLSDEQWEIFLDSIKHYGIKEPVLITRKNVAVNGHQRIMAAKVLGIRQVPYITYKNTGKMPSGKAILADMIELKLQQRWDETNKAKLRNCIRELEDIYGIRQGSAGQRMDFSTGMNHYPKTQWELAEKIGVSISQYKRALSVEKLIPSLQYLVFHGLLSSSKAIGIWSKLPAEEQSKFLNRFGVQDVCEKSAMTTRKAIVEIKKKPTK